MRAFVAIELPHSALDQIEELQARLPVGRAVPRANLHVTLAFLGDQTHERLADLNDELMQIRSPAFDIRIAGLGVFGGRSPKVVFAPVAADPALMDLHRQVSGAARRVGMVLGRSRFRPHVTLARFGARGLTRSGAARLAGFAEDHAGVALPPCLVDRFTLFRSTLRSAGALYEALATYPLVDRDMSG